MCEILLRVTDKIGADLYMDCRCTKRGDVIVVCPDGWNWGLDEKTLPFYRIIKLPNVTVAQASPYVAAELPVDPLNPSRTLQRRLFKLDLANVALPAAFKTYIADNTRAAASYIFNASAATIASVVLTKPAIVDPLVIG